MPFRFSAYALMLLMESLSAPMVSALVPACDPNLRPATINASESGWISSPNYPLQYDNNLECQWLINSANNTVIAIRFTDFLTESCCDYVEIYDGPTTNSTLIFRTRNSFQQALYGTTTTQSQMLVSFRTDGSVTYPGFNATYWTAPAVGNDQQTAQCSTISQLDLSLIIPTPTDRSSWYQVKQFFSSLVSIFPISQSAVRVSAVTYRGSSQYQFGFNDYNTAPQLVTAITNLRQIPGQGTALGAAMQTVLDNVYYTGTFRRNVYGLVVALVDDQTDTSSSALMQLQQNFYALGSAVFFVGTNTNAFDSTSLISTTLFYHCEPPTAALASCTNSILYSICYGQPWTSLPQNREYQAIKGQSGNIFASSRSTSYTTAWLIVAPDPRSVISFQITTLIMKQGDSFATFDGSNSSSLQLVSFYYPATQYPGTLYSSQQYLYAQLSSSSNGGVSSYSASFTIISPCQPGVAAINPPDGSIINSTTYTTYVKFNCSVLGASLNYYQMWAVSGSSYYTRAVFSQNLYVNLYIGPYSVLCLVLTPMNSSHSTECVVASRGAVTSGTNTNSGLPNCPSYLYASDQGTSAFFNMVYFYSYSVQTPVSWSVNSSVGYLSTRINYVYLPLLNYSGPYMITMTTLFPCSTNVSMTTRGVKYPSPVACPNYFLIISPNGAVVNVGAYFTCQSFTSLSQVAWNLNYSGGSLNVAGSSGFSLPSYVVGPFNLSCSSVWPCSQVTSPTVYGTACPYTPNISPSGEIINVAQSGLTFFCNVQQTQYYSYAYQWIGIVGGVPVNNSYSQTFAVTTSGYFNLTCAVSNVSQCPVLWSIPVTGYISFFTPQYEAVSPLPTPSTYTSVFPCQGTQTPTSRTTSGSDDSKSTTVGAKSGNNGDDSLRYQQSIIIGLAVALGFVILVLIVLVAFGIFYARIHVSGSQKPEQTTTAVTNSTFTNDLGVENRSQDSIYESPADTRYDGLPTVYEVLRSPTSKPERPIRK